MEYTGTLATPLVTQYVEMMRGLYLSWELPLLGKLSAGQLWPISGIFCSTWSVQRGQVVGENLSRNVSVCSSGEPKAPVVFGADMHSSHWELSSRSYRAWDIRSLVQWECGNIYKDTRAISLLFSKKCPDGLLTSHLTLLDRRSDPFYSSSPFMLSWNIIKVLKT